MKKVLVFGEIIWDVFADKAEIGGAPFNLSAHVSSLGHDVNMVSALGDDQLGKDARKHLEKWGVGDKYVHIVDVPTGYCKVTLDEVGHPSYDLASGVAYDNIPITETEEEYDALAFGSLAVREYASYKSLMKLLEGKYKTVFYDVNVRKPHFYPGIAKELIKYVNILKLSREEALDLEMGDNPEAVCLNVLERYPNVEQVLLTCDKDGAILYHREKGKIQSPMPKSKPVSTVGAGDSFSACYLANYLNGVDPEQCLARAVGLSDYVITKLGAVMEIPEELRKTIID